MTKQDGGLAFPAVDNWRLDSGMTLRDYFAAKAMQAIIRVTNSSEVCRDWDESIKTMASNAYGFADAMLAEREKNHD